MRNWLSIFLISLVILNAQSQQPYEKDPYSHFQHSNFVIKHKDIVWDIDLENEVVKASINYTIETIVHDSVLKLDIWNLDYVQDSAQITFKNKTTNVTIAVIKNNTPILGQAYLDIGLGTHTPAKGELFNVYLEYQITNKSKSMTWFTQIGSDGQPYKGIFTQAKAIYARGLFPTQDSPQVRFTWQATVSVKLNQQRLLMPGELISKTFFSETNKTEFIFKQTQEVPAHGFGMWLDNYEQQRLNLDVEAYINTKEVTTKYLIEYFSDTESLISYLEDYLGQQLRQYDAFKLKIVIGPNFSPLGGDTYPGIVILSNDILPYEKKNTLGKSVLINSIARMWFGYQLVPKLWNCQFLSYGISTYLERYIIKNVYDSRDDDSIYRERSTIGNDTLYLFVQRVGQNSTRTTLVPELEDLEDPIELINIATYEKGYQLISYIDQAAIGPGLTQTFLSQWLKNSTGKFVDEEDFKNSLHEFIKDMFRAAAPTIWGTISINNWYTHPGMMGGVFREILSRNFRPKSQDTIEQKAFYFLHLGGFALPPGWNSLKYLNVNEQVIFLNYFMTRIEQLNEDPDTERMLRVLDLKFGYSKSKEQQILFPWVTLGLQTDYDEEVIGLAYQILEVATAQSIVIPMYEALVFSDKTPVAQALYDKNKNLYHNLVSSHIERILKDEDDDQIYLH